MSERWAAWLATADASSLGGFRLERGIEVHAEEGRVWLRGERFEELELRLRAMPGVHLFLIRDADALAPPGKLAPTGVMPTGFWMPIAKWLSCEPPAAGWP